MEIVKIYVSRLACKLHFRSKFGYEIQIGKLVHCNPICDKY